MSTLPMKPVSCIGDTTGNGNTRWHIDAVTLAVLEKVFTLDQFPNVETRKQLGAELSVSTRQIQVWFQNRRQRERKNRSGLGRSNSGLEGVMPTMQATPLSSCDDITTVLFEFGSKKDDSKSLCGLPLAPMPRLNSPTSTSGGSIPSTPGGSCESLPMDSGPPDAYNFCLSGPNGSLSPPLEERPLARPDSLLASAQPRPIWPGGTASISSWTPPPSSVPPKGGPAPSPRPLAGALPPAPVAPPDVAAKLAQACQTSLIARTLQDYGGIVQVITEPRAPFHVLSVSPGWERLTGYSRDEVVGRPLKVLQGAQTESEMVALLMRSVQEQRPVSVRITNYTKQGVSFVHQLSSEPLRDASGRTQCFQATSLVLRRPGEEDAAEEISIGQLPLLLHDKVPPLWPLLARAGPPPSTPAPTQSSLSSPSTYLSNLLQPLPTSQTAVFASAFAASAAASMAIAAAEPPPPKAQASPKLPTESEFDLLGGWQEKELLQLLGGGSSDLELVKELDEVVASDVESAFMQRATSPLV